MSSSDRINKKLNYVNPISKNGEGIREIKLGN